ncbi:tetratricopeptide repeat protein [Cyanobacterium stanieri LEGE 03274]|uniref:Tetratricopeptide repeat protein n=1 Tax=Cyanobacterium stanieri LEGE 03274 TaxID=1828756 RepID=A0ABR9V0H2_9CHRO|nr:tetratricopeptide repeat protein [Cyanobacterium stanieri]MBE9221380.1 tetratricopeptide repeat protein [Cyanobacterium stanieri LEGE 03274]
MFLKKGFIIYSWLILLLTISSVFNPVVAQNRRANPINENVRDELLPRRNNLTQGEKEALKIALEELNQLAQSQLELGNEDEAFDIWYRQIRLTRFLGAREEVELIGEVGAVAWARGRGDDVNFLSERLSVLQRESTTNNLLNPQLLPYFLEAYETLRDVDNSIALRRQLLDDARGEDEEEDIINNLEALGSLYLSKFDYFNAQPIYEELLTFAQENNNFLAESNYLRRLSEINGAILRPENAVEYKKQLIANYVRNNNLRAVALLEISMGDDYKLLDNPQEAANFYQEAFNTAWAQGQFAIATDALKRLANLYQEYEQLDSALTVYDELIKLQQQAYNYYGLMETYESMGIIYQQQGNINQARIYFSQALQIAQEINYKQDYYQNLLSQL